GDYLVEASVTDEAGNPVEAERTFTVAAAGDNVPTLTIETPVAGDDVVNATEHEQALIINGASTGLTAGTEVQVSLEGKDYTTTVAADGSWTLEVPAADVSALVDGEVIVDATAVNEVGNTAEISHQFTVATEMVPVVVKPIAEDDKINADEAAGDIVIDGTTVPGADVVVDIDGEKYPTTADDDGNWSVVIPPEAWDNVDQGDLPIIVDVTDKDGNQGEVEREVEIDTLPPTLVIDAIAEDDVVNAIEHLEALEIGGSTT